MRNPRPRDSRRILILILAIASGAALVSSEPLPHLVPRVLDDGVVLNVPQRLIAVMKDGIAVAMYPVGLGRPDWPTFVGPFTIAAKEVDPTWDVPASIQEEQRRAGKPVLTRVPPGPANPLGKYWLGLSVPGYGIHGTNAPQSIARFQSHGCIRLRAEDIADLFTRVEIGTPGISVYEPVVLALIDGALWLEAHPDEYRRGPRHPLEDVITCGAHRSGRHRRHCHRHRPVAHARRPPLSHRCGAVRGAGATLRTPESASSARALACILNSSTAPETGELP